jgi:hypothetical protein
MKIGMAKRCHAEVTLEGVTGSRFQAPEESTLSQNNPHFILRRRTGNRSDKRLALRVRQISVLLGGMVVLAAGTLWLTGIIKPMGADIYKGTNEKMNPALVDPALQTQTEPTQELVLEDPMPVPEGNTVPASADWLNKRIEAHKDEIDAQDLMDFSLIISKLDQGYIGDLAANGMETGEEDLLKAHLHSRLSAAEYERSKVLFSNYSYLMYEE